MATDSSSVFFLDCEDRESSLYGTSTQIEWFVQSVERSNAAWKIAVLHQPVLSCCDEGEERSKLGKRLNSISEFHKIPIVLSGHCHCYNRIQDEFQSTQFVVGNGVCDSELIVQPADGVGYTKDPVFLVLDVFKDKIQTTTISIKGEIVDQTEIPLPRANSMIDPG